jgi:hypothetical protein
VYFFLFGLSGVYFVNRIWHSTLPVTKFGTSTKEHNVKCVVRHYLHWQLWIYGGNSINTGDRRHFGLLESADIRQTNTDQAQIIM